MGSPEKCGPQGGNRVHPRPSAELQSGSCGPATAKGKNPVRLVLKNPGQVVTSDSSRTWVSRWSHSRTDGGRLSGLVGADGR